MQNGRELVLQPYGGGSATVVLRIVTRVAGGGQADIYAVERVADDRRAPAGRLPARGIVLRIERGVPAAGEIERLVRRDEQLMAAETADPIGLEGLVRVRCAGFVQTEYGGPSRFAQVQDFAGTALRDVLPAHRRRASRPPSALPLTGLQWAAVFAPPAAALGALHRRGMLHRDVKPGNLLLLARRGADRHGAEGAAARDLLDAGLPFLRLSDFGALVDGRVVPRGGGGVASAVRSGPYQPPEVYFAEGWIHPAPATDTWMFAASLYEALTGRLPFTGYIAGERSLGYFERVLAGHPDDAAWPTLDSRIAALLWQCLALDPSARPSMDAVARELRTLGRAGRHVVQLRAPIRIPTGTERVSHRSSTTIVLPVPRPAIAADPAAARGARRRTRAAPVLAALVATGVLVVVPAPLLRSAAAAWWADVLQLIARAAGGS